MDPRGQRLIMLHEAAVALSKGDVASARARIDALAPTRLTDAPADASADALAMYAYGVLAFALGDYHQGLVALEQAATDPRLRPLALATAQRRAAVVGWDLEARALLVARQVDSPGSARLLAEELALCRRYRDSERALVVLDRLLAIQADSVPWRLERANVLLELHAIDAMRAELEHLATLPSSGASEPAVLERVRLLVEADRVELAEALVDAHAARAPDSASFLVQQARFASWRGEYERATGLAERAVAVDPGSGDAYAVLGGSSFMLGRHAIAESAIDRAMQLDGGCEEVTLWKAEILAARGEHARVEALLTRIPGDANGQAQVAASLARVEHGLVQLPLHHCVSTYELEECLPAIDALLPDREGPRAEQLTAEAVLGLVRAARAELRGNRSVQATRMSEGILRRLPFAARTGPRHASRAAVESLRSESVDTVLDVLSRLEREYPSSPMPPCHRGEVALWDMRLDEAEADFRRALDLHHQTRFAYIGLMGVAMLRGRYEEALAVSAEGVRILHHTEGPAVFVYRGECLRRLGRLEEAERDLERAVAVSPSRLSARINLAIVYAARGARTRADEAYADVRDRAPALLADARRELVAEGQSADPASTLERALVLLGGNRGSSVIVYRTAGRTRIAPGTPGSFARIHRDDARVGAELAALLGSQLGGRGSSRTRAW